MKKYDTGKVTLLTLLVSLACPSFSSVANDDEEILKLFNETARSLPSASAGTAQTREEILSAQLKAWQKENRQLQKRIAQLETLRAEAEKKAALSLPAGETDRLIEKLEDEIRENKQTIARQALALKAAEAKSNGQESDLKITNLTQQLHETEKQLVQLRQEKQSAAAQLKQQAERQKELQNLQAKLEATEKQLAQLQKEKQLAAAQLSQQQADRQKDLQNLQAKLEATEKQLAQLQKEKQLSAAQLSQQQADRQKDLQNLQTKLEATEKQLAQLQKEKQLVAAQLSQQQADRQKDLQNLQTKLEATEKQLAQLQKEKQLSAAQLNQQQADRQKELQNLQAERQKALQNLQTTLEATEKQLAQLQQEKQGVAAQLSQQQAERQKELQNAQAKLEATEKQLAQLQQEKQGVAAKTSTQSDEQKQLQSQLAALQQQYQQSQQEYEKQRQRADKLDKELAQLTQLANSGKALAQDVSQAVKSGSPASSPLPKTEAERDSYALGQFLATNVGAQIKIIKDAGINILPDALNAGLTTRLNDGKSALSDKEMEARYRKLDEKVNQGMNMLIGKGYGKLKEKIGNRKPLKQNEGIAWFALKPVKTRLKANETIAVTVKITTLDDKVINAFSDEHLAFDQNLPPLLYEALSLTGKGGEVEGWALAQDIFEREPLPGWVPPYEVIHYQLSVK